MGLIVLLASLLVDVLKKIIVGGEKRTKDVVHFCFVSNVKSVKWDIGIVGEMLRL